MVWKGTAGGQFDRHIRALCADPCDPASLRDLPLVHGDYGGVHDALGAGPWGLAQCEKPALTARLRKPLQWLSMGVCRIGDRGELGLTDCDARIQNSVLGLVLIHSMAIVAAFWGIWHAISGITIATLMSRTKATR